MAAPTAENATIVINGAKYSFWTSVTCERTFGEPVSYATLETAEIGPTSQGFANLKIGVGDKGQVFLAGQLAVTGEIDMRQVFYDATNHGVQVRLHCYVQDLLASSVKAAPGQYTNSTLAQIAGVVCAPYNINAVIQGSPPGAGKVFERVSERVGETCFDFITRLAYWRDLHMVDDSSGRNLIFARGGAASGTFALVEGENILSARCVQQYSYAAAQYEQRTQNFGTNEHYGQVAAQVSATAANRNYSGPRKIIVAGAEMGDKTDAQMAANHEMSIATLSMFEADITVPGWLAPDGALWLNKVSGTPQQIALNSPMIYPSNAATLPTLYLKGCKSIQNDKEGSVSILSLCLQSGLGGSSQINEMNQPAGAP